MGYLKTMEEGVLDKKLCVFMKIWLFICLVSSLWHFFGQRKKIYRKIYFAQYIKSEYILNIFFPNPGKKEYLGEIKLFHFFPDFFRFCFLDPFSQYINQGQLVSWLEGRDSEKRMN